MKEFFSCIPYGKGFCCTFSTIYKRDPYAKVYILSDGDDFERSAFFEALINDLSGYQLTVFNSFFDETPTGIYIENINTYILSDCGYDRISPVLSGIWEKNISIVSEKSYPVNLRREITANREKEKKFYKEACEQIQKAVFIKDKIHHTMSNFLIDDKLLNFISRFCVRILKTSTSVGNSTIRLLSSVTPLGFHTHYDTIFSNFESIFDIKDDSGFIGSIFLGVVKDYALAQKIPFIMSPSYFASDIPQFLLFPTLNAAVTLSDQNHRLPFEPTERFSATRFLQDPAVIKSEKINTLLSVENRMLEKSVKAVYDGREERFHANSLIFEFSDSDEAKASAHNLAEKLLN